MLCNPAEKLESPNLATLDPPPFPAHLAGYALEAASLEPTAVFTRDPWGVQEILFHQTVALLEPATENQPQAPLPEGLPHHCYRVEKARPIGADLLLVGPFGE